MITIELTESDAYDLRWALGMYAMYASGPADDTTGAFIKYRRLVATAKAFIE